MALTTDERPRRARQKRNRAFPAPFAARNDSAPFSSADTSSEAAPPHGHRKKSGVPLFAAPASSFGGGPASANSTLALPPAPRALTSRTGEAQESRTYFLAKRLLDIVLTLALLTALAPLLLLIAAAIWLEDRGPMLYYQNRIGRNGVPFRFYKFRSMVQNADALKERLIETGGNEAGAVIFKMKDDPRITRVGKRLRKYSLDELPQFLNVLRGEMSLVGPRPHLPREVAAYKKACYHQRNRVAPGLLCLREVQGRSNLTFEQWIALDLLYIEHQGMRTDLWILLRALPAVLRAEGAC